MEDRRSFPNKEDGKLFQKEEEQKSCALNK